MDCPTILLDTSDCPTILSYNGAKDISICPYSKIRVEKTRLFYRRGIIYLHSLNEIWNPPGAGSHY